MDIIKLQKETPGLSHGTVVALGMFDGIHRGHMQVLRYTRSLAQKQGYAALVWTFGSPPFGAASITDNSERVELFRSLGLDYVLFEYFEKVRDLSPAAFVGDVLIGRLYCMTAVCGFNFSFGAGAQGTPGTLGKLMRDACREAVALPAVENGGEAISSTRIRCLIETGDVEKAALLLGRPYSLKNIIIHGSSIGHTIGFPTINMNIPAGRVVPAYGVYITEVLIGGVIKRGVTNVGVKPTVGGLDAPLCETHILDFDGVHYGEYAEIRFLAFRRPERRFENLTQLKEAIGEDIKAAYSCR